MTLSLSSVRLRLALGALAALSLALVISWFGLVALFERHVERRIGSELGVHLSQIVAHTAVASDGQLSLEQSPSDPRFDRVQGGLYWQIRDEGTGRLLRSRSLWDVRLELPRDMPAVGLLDLHDIAGPRGAVLHAHERRVILPAGEGERVVRFVVAIDRAEIDALTGGFADDARLALLGLGLVLAAASILQISLGVAPLAGIGRQVAAVRDGSAKRLPPAPADEVRPLVTEVNALLETVEAQVARARARAADLAHGLKTPLSALKADAARLSSKGETVIAADIDAAVDAMTAQVERELTRTRIRHGTRCAGAPFRRVTEGVINVIRRTPEAQSVTVDVDASAEAVVPVDETDLAEIMGNLVENAVRHARSCVKVALEVVDAQAARVVVDDDGPGLDEAQRGSVMQRGERLDTRAQGAGLGLAIVADILEAYGSTLSLGASPEGGLRASFVLRASSLTTRS
jgi:signal transduction histidine kinase